MGFARAWAGGQYFAAASMPGFVVLGPVFHVYRDLTGSCAAATVLCGLSESAILYGSETKNAQVAYNQSAVARGLPQVTKTQRAWSPWGPGISLHIARNILAMSGLRVFSAPCQDVAAAAVPAMSPGLRTVLGDLVANCFVSALSTPLHQLYQFRVTQGLVGAVSPQSSVAAASVAFLRQQYLTPAGRISSVAARDSFLRVAYNASIFTMFGAIERAMVKFWPQSWRQPTI